MELPEITDDFMRSELARTGSYTLVLLRPGPHSEDPESRPIIWEHGRRNFALREAGLLPIVGPITGDGPFAGLCIFAAGVAETTDIMAGDPAVLAGVLGYELHPMRGFPGATLPG